MQNRSITNCWTMRLGYTCSWQVHQIGECVTSGTLIINVNAAIRCVAFARYSSAILTRSLLRHYRCSFDLQFNAFSRQPAHKRVWDFTGILFCKVAIRITNQVLSILDEAIDASPQPRSSVFPPFVSRFWYSLGTEGSLIYLRA